MIVVRCLLEEVTWVEQEISLHICCHHIVPRIRVALTRKKASDDVDADEFEGHTQRMGLSQSSLMMPRTPHHPVLPLLLDLEQCMLCNHDE